MMRGSVLQAMIAAAFTISFIVGCSDSSTPDSSPSTSTESVGADKLAGKSVGDLRKEFWSDNKKFNVHSFSTNAVTGLYLGEQADLDTTPVEDGFIVVATFFCEPDQAYVYAVDGDRTKGKLPSKEFKKWEHERAMSRFCDGKRPSRSVGTR